MATIAQLEELIKKIGEQSGGDIPGLNEDAILTALAEKNAQLKEALAEAETAADKEAIKARFKATFQSYVNEQIATIRAAYAEIKEGIKGIKASVASAITTTALPPAIGAPPVAPNPIYALAENKQKIAALEAQTTSLNNVFLKLLQAAKNIDFPVPDSVVALLNAILDIKKLLKTIPS